MKSRTSLFLVAAVALVVAALVFYRRWGNPVALNEDWQSSPEPDQEHRDTMWKNALEQEETSPFEHETHP